MTTTPLQYRCATCSQSLELLTDCYTNLEKYVVTPCSHIFHKDCLKPHVSGAESNCPNCKATIYQHQGGKTFKTIWEIFLKALRLDLDFVFEKLATSSHDNGKCSICIEPFPIPSLVFDPKKKQLFHTGCQPPSGVYPLLIEDMAKVSCDYREKDPETKVAFTPTPPSSFERFKRDHPTLTKVAYVAAASMTAFLLNAWKYQGQSKILFTLSLPTVIALKVAQQVGTLLSKILD